MENIHRYIVSDYGEEEGIKTKGKILFINCPFKKSLKIYSFQGRKFKQKIYAKNLEKYNITCVEHLGYSLQNILFYVLLNNLEKYDCLCFEMAGFGFSTIIRTKQFLVQLGNHLDNKMVLIVVREDAIEENDIFSEFPIYR